MEVAVGLFAGLGGTGAAAAGATGLGAMLGGSTALTILQGLATAGGVIATMSAGQAAQSEGMSNAALAEIQGQQAFIESEQTAAQIAREHVQKVGQARVAFAASGLDISSGAAVENALGQEAKFATSIEKSNGRMRQAQAAMRAEQFRLSADNAMTGAMAKSGGMIAQTGIDIIKRG